MCSHDDPSWINREERKSEDKKGKRIRDNIAAKIGNVLNIEDGVAEVGVGSTIQSHLTGIYLGVGKGRGREGARGEDLRLCIKNQPCMDMSVDLRIYTEHIHTHKHTVLRQVAEKSLWIELFR